MLPSAGISATDPEGTAVSFSLDCAYVDINSASGIVTMTTAYDIDTSSTSPFTISCNVMATDATSQVATTTLDVIVSDANDIAPVFTPAAYTSYIAQGRTSLHSNTYFCCETFLFIFFAIELHTVRDANS